VPSPFDFLSSDEKALTATAIRDLATEAWARPLISGISDRGGYVAANKASFFELRFGHALCRSGITPNYESCGEGASTLDFEFVSDGQTWKVELMRLEETQAARDATYEGVDADGTRWFGRHLYTSAEDKRQSVDGEMLKAIQRICQKCEKDGRPYKFPLPNGSYHALLVDMSTFLNGGGDNWDRVHIGFGASRVPHGCRMHWDGNPITGVFDPTTSVRGAHEARQRLHFIGFVNEPKIRLGEFGAATQFIANPHLFSDEDEVRKAMTTWPLQPVALL
jgi:hypothetical protein